MDKEFIINLRVDNVKYPLQISRDDEEVYRRAAEQIDYKLGQYKSHFAAGETQALQSKDYMAMTAIQAVAEKAKHELRAEKFEERVKSLTNELDVFLKKRVR